MKLSSLSRGEPMIKQRRGHERIEHIRLTVCGRANNHRPVLVVAYLVTKLLSMLLVVPLDGKDDETVLLAALVIYEHRYAEDLCMTLSTLFDDFSQFRQIHF